MTIDILMPALSPTMEVGTLAKWMVKKGDIIKAGDLLAEIETDKAIMEFEAVDEGTILELSVKEGQTDIKVNSIIAKITSETLETLKNNKKSQEPLAEVKSDVDNLKIREKLIPNIEQINNVENKKNRIFATPLAKKVYEDEGIDISSQAARVKDVMKSALNGRRIVVFSGGSKKGIESVYDDARAIRDGGGNGSIIGRNSFQRSYPDALEMLNNLIEIYKGKA